VAGTDSSGRGTLPVSAQAVYDRGIAVGLLLTALLFGAASETEAALVFGIAGAAALIVTSITRYSARPA
jgi:positive regulator of sigma E activity